MNTPFEANFSPTLQHSSGFNYFLLCVCISFFLVACGENGNNPENKTSPEVTEAVVKIPLLNANNINDFTHDFANNYLRMVDKLLTSFYKYKETDDPYGFAQHRNFHWTPQYIEKKEYYLATFEQNRAFLDSSKIKPLFILYEELIFHGLDLKHGFLDKNQPLLVKTIAKLQQEKIVVNRLIKSADPRLGAPHTTSHKEG